MCLCEVCVWCKEGCLGRGSKQVDQCLLVSSAGVVNLCRGVISVLHRLLYFAKVYVSLYQAMHLIVDVVSLVAE